MKRCKDTNFDFTSLCVKMETGVLLKSFYNVNLCWTLFAENYVDQNKYMQKYGARKFINFSFLMSENVTVLLLLVQ